MGENEMQEEQQANAQQVASTCASTIKCGIGSEKGKKMKIIRRFVQKLCRSMFLS